MVFTTDDVCAYIAIGVLTVVVAGLFHGVAHPSSPPDLLDGFLYVLCGVFWPLSMAVVIGTLLAAAASYYTSNLMDDD
jgi:hydrogenase/urease accessory protein HupE